MALFVPGKLGWVRMYLILVGVGVGPIFNRSANMNQNYNRYSKNLRCMVRLWIFMHLWA